MLRLSSYLSDVMMQIRTCFMSEMCAAKERMHEKAWGGGGRVKLQEMLPIVTYETNERGTESGSSAYQLTKGRVMLPN